MSGLENFFKFPSLSKLFLIISIKYEKLREAAVSMWTKSFEMFLSVNLFQFLVRVWF